MVLDPHWAGNCLYSVGDPSFQAPGESHNQGLVSETRLNGVSVAQRKRVNPPLVTTSRIRASPACALSAKPTSCESSARMFQKLRAESAAKDRDALWRKRLRSPRRRQ